MTAGAVAAVVLAAAVALAVGWAIGRRSRPPGPVPEPSADPIAGRPGPDRANAVDNLPGALWNLPLGIVVADRDGAVVYRNEVAERYSDARHGEALVEAAVRDLLQVAPEAGRGEKLLDLYGPPRRRVLVKAAPMLVDGVPSGSLVVIEDITERQRIEAVRRDFVANVSHELKTPVGAIGVLAEALQDADDPVVVARLADRLQAEALRLGHTIDDLLALSRIESGELFELAELDLDAIVVAALERNASPAERREVTLEAQAAPNPVVVLGDRRQLISAVGNLVENAIKYSEIGSRVTVGVSADGEHGSITVSDRGVGIPPADLERVFERFYRVDQARSRVTGGTGLGLSIVRHVALNHGGEVRVRSAEGAGSSFTLRLPLAATAIGPVPDTASGGPAVGEPDRPAAVTQERA